jgi:hypothetical protein
MNKNVYNSTSFSASECCISTVFCAMRYLDTNPIATATATPVFLSALSFGSLSFFQPATTAPTAMPTMAPVDRPSEVVLAAQPVTATVTMSEEEP